MAPAVNGAGAVWGSVILRGSYEARRWVLRARWAHGRGGGAAVERAERRSGVERIYTTTPELCGANLLFVYALARTFTKSLFVAAAVAPLRSIAAKLC